MSKRGAAGYFHLEASLAGVATEVLRDHATGEYAQICIKSQRNKTVFGSGPGWEKMGIGPYADHSACVPSHRATWNVALAGIPLTRWTREPAPGTSTETRCDE